MVKKKMETKINQPGKQQFDMSAVLVTKKSLGIFLSKMDQQRAKQHSKEQRLLSFISHPNESVLCVLKKLYTPALSETKKILRSSFIYHPNGIILQVFNQQ